MPRRWLDEAEASRTRNGVSASAGVRRTAIDPAGDVVKLANGSPFASPAPGVDGTLDAKSHDDIESACVMDGLRPGFAVTEVMSEMRTRWGQGRDARRS